MATSRRKSSQQKPTNQQKINSVTPSPTGKIFLGEEDKRLLKKLSKHIVNKLGLGGNRSVKM